MEVSENWGTRTLSGSSDNQDYTILGKIQGTPVFGNAQMAELVATQAQGQMGGSQVDMEAVSACRGCDAD